MTRAQRSRSTSRGQGLVEFALVLPVFMVILIGMVDLGRAIWANNSAANAAREAARFASVHGGSCEDLTGSVCSSSNYCPVGPLAAGAVAPSTSASCPYPSPSKQSIYNTATGFLVGGATTTVTACYWVPSTLTNTDGTTRLAATSSCSGNTDTASTNTRGAAVTVVVSTTVPMTLGALLGRSTITVSATSTMLINH